jgi:carboxyl-terminal processing protease
MRDKITKYVLIILIPGLGLSCRNITSQNCSPMAQKYLDEVIDVLRNNSVNKNTIDWEDFRNDIYRHANNALTIEDTYPSIDYAIALLEDHHSYFVANNVTQDTLDVDPLPELHDESVPQSIGYIRLGFCMGDEERTNTYINAIAEKIAKQDDTQCKGWIVDLRGNFGGNMWPMLTAIRPILGEGIVGYSCYPDSSFYAWSYSGKEAFRDNELINGASDVHHLQGPDPFVAVLTDSITASSGEAIAIAFKGRPKTMSFGTKTYGVSTGNRIHILSDGSRINLTECVFADRNKTKYGGPVEPDVKCNQSAILSKAINWIESQ